MVGETYAGSVSSRHGFRPRSSQKILEAASKNCGLRDNYRQYPRVPEASTTAFLLTASSRR